MRPLPYHLATPLLLEKLVRPAGFAPAFPDWKPDVLLLDDGRMYQMKTNTAASPVMDSHPQDDFSADLSVFQAHLPCHESIYKFMSKPLVYISPDLLKSETTRVRRSFAE